MHTWFILYLEFTVSTFWTKTKTWKSNDSSVLLISTLFYSCFGHNAACMTTMLAIPFIPFKFLSCCGIYHQLHDETTSNFLPLFTQSYCVCVSLKVNSYVHIHSVSHVGMFKILFQCAYEHFLTGRVSLNMVWFEIFGSWFFFQFLEHLKDIFSQFNCMFVTLNLSVFHYIFCITGGTGSQNLLTIRFLTLWYVLYWKAVIITYCLYSSNRFTL